MTKEQWAAVKESTVQVAAHGNDTTRPLPSPMAVVSDNGDSVLLYTTSCSTLGSQMSAEMELAVAAPEDRELINNMRAKVSCECPSGWTGASSPATPFFFSLTRTAARRWPLTRT